MYLTREDRRLAQPPRVADPRDGARRGTRVATFISDVTPRYEARRARDRGCSRAQRRGRRQEGANSELERVRVLALGQREARREVSLELLRLLDDGEDLVVHCLRVWVETRVGVSFGWQNAPSLRRRTRGRPGRRRTFCALSTSAGSSFFATSAPSSKNSFFAFLSAALKKASFSEASIFTDLMSIFVDVAIVYDWFTRRRGTPFTVYGPVTNSRPLSPLQAHQVG